MQFEKVRILRKRNTNPPQHRSAVRVRVQVTFGSIGVLPRIPRAKPSKCLNATETSTLIFLLDLREILQSPLVPVKIH